MMAPPSGKGVLESLALAHAPLTRIVLGGTGLSSGSGVPGGLSPILVPSGE